MISPHFQFPFRHFAEKIAVIGYAPTFLFKEIYGDGGLRNACQCFWNARGATTYGICNVEILEGEDWVNYLGEVSGDSTSNSPDPCARAANQYVYDPPGKPWGDLKSFGSVLYGGFSTTVSFGIQQYVIHGGRYGVRGYAVINHHGENLTVTVTTEPGENDVQGTLVLPGFFDPCTDFWAQPSNESTRPVDAYMEVTAEEFWQYG